MRGLVGSHSDMAYRLGVTGWPSLTGCYRPDCVGLVSGCRDAVSVLSDMGRVSVRVLPRIWRVDRPGLERCRDWRG